jgi:AraC-like DNA-binding protein
MNKLFSTTKIYTNPELKLGEVAERLGISSMKLSYVFSQHLHKNYYDYVNEYRIAEFKRLVASSDANKYTLIALSEQAGFSSRASFFRNFKKLEGIAPGEYIKGVKNEE